MPPVLTTASTLTCGPGAPHAGTVSVTGARSLRVGGAGVLTKVAVKEGSITGCTNQSSSTTKCSGIAPAEPTGIATRLKVDGAFVALSTLKAKTNGVPPSTVVVVNAANDLLTAV
jgi:hypothetical protein